MSVGLRVGCHLTLIRILKLEFSRFLKNIHISEQIEVRKCLLSFGAESSVFQVAIQKFKDQGIQNYNFACCFVCV